MYPGHCEITPLGGTRCWRGEGDGLLKSLPWLAGVAPWFPGTVFRHVTAHPGEAGRARQRFCTCIVLTWPSQWMITLFMVCN